RIRPAAKSSVWSQTLPARLSRYSAKSFFWSHTHARTLPARPSRKLHFQRSYPKHYISSAVFHLTKIRCFAPPNLSFGFLRQFTNQCFAPSKNTSALVSSMHATEFPKKRC
uniref:Uncharacterized protein n=1 Tax=Triticum urartu TaxID=4572 RepID=A0A8R7U1E0_TRIUA